MKMNAVKMRSTLSSRGAQVDHFAATFGAVMCTSPVSRGAVSSGSRPGPLRAIFMAAASESTLHCYVERGTAKSTGCEEGRVLYAERFGGRRAMYTPTR